MKKTMKIIALILATAFCLFSLSACKEGKQTCLKCGGSGKVRDTYGYYAYVACPRCHGAGYLIY